MAAAMLWIATALVAGQPNATTTPGPPPQNDEGKAASGGAVSTPAPLFSCRAAPQSPHRDPQAPVQGFGCCLGQVVWVKRECDSGWSCGVHTQRSRSSPLNSLNIMALPRPLGRLLARDAGPGLRGHGWSICAVGRLQTLPRTKHSTMTIRSLRRRLPLLSYSRCLAALHLFILSGQPSDERAS